MARKSFDVSRDITRAQVAGFIGQILPKGYAMPELGENFKVEFRVEGEKVTALVPV